MAANETRTIQPAPYVRMEQRGSESVLKLEVVREDVTWEDSENLRPLVTVEVWPPRPDHLMSDGALLSAQISWPSIGAVAPDLAAVFAKAVTVACYEADRMNREAAAAAEASA